MSIYRCQYSVVTAEGENIEQTSTQMSEDLSKYDTDLKANLSPWKDEDTVRPTFDKAKDGVIEEAQKYAEFGEKLGQHIQRASEKIKTLDSDLAGLKI